MHSDLNAFCQVIYFTHGYKIVDPLIHIWDNFAFGLSIVIFVKSSRVHILQEYILTSSKCSAMRKVYVWKCVSKMSLCFQSPFGTVQCLFVIEKQFIAKSLSVRRHNIFETLSISKHF